MRRRSRRLHPLILTAVGSPDVGADPAICRGPAGLVVFGGVIALAKEHGLEGLVCGEVGAGLANRFVAAVDLGRSLAPAVAEKTVVNFALQSAHSGPDGGGFGGLVFAVEGFD